MVIFDEEEFSTENFKIIPNKKSKRVKEREREREKEKEREIDG